MSDQSNTQLTRTGGPGTSQLADPLVVGSAAQRLKCSPTALARRVEAALPAIVEQNLYLAVEAGTASPLMPEQFRDLIDRLNTKGRSFEVSDFEVRYTEGSTTVLYPASQFVDLLEIALGLMGKWEEEGRSDAAPLSLAQACELAFLYQDSAPDIVATIEDNLDLFRGAVGMHVDANPTKVVGRVLHRLLRRLKIGGVNPITADEIVALIES